MLLVSNCTRVLPSCPSLHGYKLSQLLHDAVGGRDGPDVVAAPVHPDEGGPAEVGLAVGLRLGLLPPVHQAAARHADLQRRHVPQLA